MALSISWNFWLHYLILVVPAFFCWLCLFLHGGLFLLVAGLAMSLGPRRRRTEEEREKNTQTLNHTVCEDLPFLRFSNIPQGKMVYVQWQ